jgi:hypothetical protein
MQNRIDFETMFKPIKTKNDIFISPEELTGTVNTKFYWTVLENDWVVPGIEFPQRRHHIQCEKPWDENEHQEFYFGKMPNEIRLELEKAIALQIFEAPMSTATSQEADSHAKIAVEVALKILTETSLMVLQSVQNPRLYKRGFDTFTKIYQPIPKLPDAESSDEWCHDPDELPADLDPHFWWTLVDGDNGMMMLTRGIRYIDRLGYMECKIPWNENDEYLDYCWEEDDDYLVREDNEITF